ncbi:hypothetical protein [Emticicia aquatilis]|uniref:hypothetical protein n=1 Tax=Emticicia aquatilis TaxID=1537369 RepID=UPI00166D2E4A|nr:hypothetical protein [Emticicia aquatilis]
MKNKPVIETKKLCYLKDADHGHGVIYNLGYNTNNQLITFDGFPDFNKINYENSLPKKVYSSFDESYFITYEYDVKGNPTLINFLGKDSRDKPFEFKSKVYTNSKKQIERIDLTMPVFDNILVTTFEYDANNNIKKMYLVENGKNKLLLENLSFDDKKSPYLNTPLNNLMMYFTIFSATIGGENTTYFQNKNNATSTKIYNDSGDMTYTYKYEYTAEGYASKVKVVKKQNGKEESHDETYTYTCK